MPVFRRRPVEVYTDPGQLGGSDAPIVDAALRLAVPPGNNIVAFQSHGALQQIRAAVKEGEEAIVPESLPEPRAPRVRLPTVRHATVGSLGPRVAPRVGKPEKKRDHAFARRKEERTMDTTKHDLPENLREQAGVYTHSLGRAPPCHWVP